MLSHASKYSTAIANNNMVKIKLASERSITVKNFKKPFSGIFLVIF